jgi:hypothetical protein
MGRAVLFARMEAASGFQAYLEGALETFGIQADEEERAVMSGVWAIYEPGMELLRDTDLDDVEPELGADLSKPPIR